MYGQSLRGERLKVRCGDEWGRCKWWQENGTDYFNNNKEKEKNKKTLKNKMIKKSLKIKSSEREYNKSNQIF